MIYMMRGFLAACLLATPIFAQSLNSKYENVGEFAGNFGETAVVLYSLFDLEKDRSMVTLRDTAGLASVSVRARKIGDDGDPTNPGVSFTIGPIGAGGDGVRSDVFYNDVSGYYVSDNDIGGRITLTDYVQTDTSVSFSVEATLQPIKRGDDGFVIDEARSTQVISGTFSGQMTYSD